MNHLHNKHYFDKDEGNLSKIAETRMKVKIQCCSVDGMPLPAV